MKILYYIAQTICILLFILLMFMPFGGGGMIIHSLTEGFYVKELLHNYLDIKVITPAVVLINKIIGLLLWLSFFTSFSLFFVKDHYLKRKSKMALICMIIILLIIFFPYVFVTIKNNVF